MDKERGKPRRDFESNREIKREIMKRFFISISLFIFVFFAATLLTLYIQRNTRPAVFCTSLDDSIRPRDHCLMNPFRDKQPEVLAEKVLQELKTGNRGAILPYLNEENKNRILENEKKHQVENWRIGSREDSENQISLMYWVSRKNYYDGLTESVFFFFEREGNEWKLKQFNAGY
jgi:hypothetical protein